MKIGWFGLGFVIAWLSCVSAQSSENTAASQIEMPKFASEVKPLHCALDDEEHHSCMYFTSLRQRRADNLFAAGHFREALDEYSSILAKRKPNVIYLSPPIFDKCGEAAEKLGETEQALEFYTKGDCDELRAKLLVRLGRLDEAKKFCDKNIIKVAGRLRVDDHASWLRLRAIIKSKTNDTAGAVEDLKKAATELLIHESIEADKCLKSANLLIKENNLGGPLSTSNFVLPHDGRNKVFEVVKFVTTSSNPFDFLELNRVELI